MSVKSYLKKQINSITSISKITKTMKLIAISKIKKINKQIYNLKPYFDEICDIFNNIIYEINYPIYKKNNYIKNNKNICWIIINSNLGLCGNYNININKLVLQKIQKNDYIIAIGSKAEEFYINKGYKIIKTRKNIDNNFSYENMYEFTKEILSKFNKNYFNKIKIAYTRFINNVTFKSTILQLLPIIKNTQKKQKKYINIIENFESDKLIIFNNIINMYLNTILFSSIIQSQISEQASRRLAMENAINNTNDILKKLLLLYNRKRQSEITQEIIEIISGNNI